MSGLPRRGFVGAIVTLAAALIPFRPAHARGGRSGKEAMEASRKYCRDRDRCYQAARIMRQHGLQPARHGRGPEWFVQGSTTPVVTKLKLFDQWISSHFVALDKDGALLYWDDPVEALIEAEPLYIEWKAKLDSLHAALYSETC